MRAWHRVLTPGSPAAQAFDVIADRGKGVVDLVYRQVDCGSRKNSVTSY